MYVCICIYSLILSSELVSLLAWAPLCVALILSSCTRQANLLEIVHLGYSTSSLFFFLLLAILQAWSSPQAATDHAQERLRECQCTIVRRTLRAHRLRLRLRVHQRVRAVHRPFIRRGIGGDRGAQARNRERGLSKHWYDMPRVIATERAAVLCHVLSSYSFQYM